MIRPVEHPETLAATELFFVSGGGCLDRVIVMDHGIVVVEGSPADVFSDEAKMFKHRRKVCISCAIAIRIEHFLKTPYVDSRNVS